MVQLPHSTSLWSSRRPLSSCGPSSPQCRIRPSQWAIVICLRYRPTSSVISLTQIHWYCMQLMNLISLCPVGLVSTQQIIHFTEYHQLSVHGKSLNLLTPPHHYRQVTLIAMDQDFQNYNNEIQFNIIVLPNSYPWVNMPYTAPDLIISQGSFFNYTAGLQVFQDSHVNLHAKTSVICSAGLPLPDWAKYNINNRTVYGVASRVGTWHFDVSFTNDVGDTVYYNFRVTVVPRPVDVQFYSMVAVTCSAIISSFAYLIEILRFSNTVVSKRRTRNKSELYKMLKKVP